MTEKWVGITVAGKREELSARALVQATESLVRLLERAARSGGDVKGDPKFVLRRLRIGSIDVAIEASPEAGPAENAGIKLVQDGIRTLSTAAVLPDRWTLDMVRDLRSLCHLSRIPGVQGVHLDASGDTNLELVSSVMGNVLKLLDEPTVSYGSVTGTVKEWKGLKDRDKLVVRDETSGNDIEVYLPHQDDLDVGEFLRRRIVARGELTRNREGRKIKITAHTCKMIENRRSVSITEVAGVLGPDWTNGTDVVEWQRCNRAED